MIVTNVEMLETQLSQLPRKLPGYFVMAQIQRHYAPSELNLGEIELKHVSR